MLCKSSKPQIVAILDFSTQKHSQNKSEWGFHNLPWNEQKTWFLKAGKNFKNHRIYLISGNLPWAHFSPLWADLDELVHYQARVLGHQLGVISL